MKKILTGSLLVLGFFGLMLSITSPAAATNPSVSSITVGKGEFVDVQVELENVGSYDGSLFSVDLSFPADFHQISGGTVEGETGLLVDSELSLNISEEVGEDVLVSYTVFYEEEEIASGEMRAPINTPFQPS